MFFCFFVFVFFIMIRQIMESQQSHWICIWISSFITNRTQRVIFRGHMSDFVPVLSGVPQGLVLGPLLFNIYTNDLHLHLNSKVNQYADDSFISRTFNDDSDVAILQNDLNTLDWWSENNAL